MLDRLRNNLGLKLLSLAIAFVAWAYLRFTPNPVIATARFSEPITVPIATAGLAPGEVAHLSDREATLTVEVAREGGIVQPELVHAVLDLAGKGPGTYNVPVEVISPKLEIKSLSPASVTLTVERIEQHVFPVAVHFIDRQHRVVAGPVGIAPPEATLRAPTSMLVRVVGLRVDIPLPSKPARFDAMLRPVAFDVHGDAVGGVALDPNLVRVRTVFSEAAH